MWTSLNTNLNLNIHFKSINKLLTYNIGSQDEELICVS